MSSKKWKRMSAAATTQSWSNVDYKLEDFIEKFPFPQVVKVKKDGLKSSAFKAGTELVLHELRTIKKVEACVVSEGKKFVIPYDCPAKVYLLTKAEEFSTLGELRKAVPTCRYILVTSKSSDQQLKDLEAGELLTIVFKKNGSGGDVFTCQRKKLGEINVPASAVAGFAPMATTQERKISDFVRHYSTFPIGIGLSESTLSNKAFCALNELVSCADSGLIRLTRLFNDYSIMASTTGRKKSMFSIPKSAELTVTAPKPLLLEDSEHAAQCKQLHSAVDSSLVDQYLSFAISTATTNEVVQWSYGQESTCEDVTPVQKKATPKENGETKRDKLTTKAVANKTGTESKENGKEKTKDKPKPEKVKEKGKEKEKEKQKEKSKEKEKKPKQPKQKSVEEKPKPEKEVKKEANELVEDESGYLVPSELLRAERQNNKTLEGDYEVVESKEKPSKASTFGRLIGKVKGKDKEKKKERPSSAAFVLEENEPVDKVKRSTTMPATSSNVKSTVLLKNKAKTASSADMKLSSSRDELDASPSTSPTEKDVRKRDKGVFGTAGKKAGAKLRHALGRSKAMPDDQWDTSKPDSPKETSLPPSPNDKVVEEDLYVAPVDDQLSMCSSSGVQDRPLPDKPPDDPRKISAMSIPYDDEDLYDEITPVPETKNFKIPKDLTKLTVDGVSDVLRYLHMNEHVSKFRRDQIDGEIFKSLDDQLMGALGVADPIQRLKLRKLIKGWRPKN